MLKRADDDVAWEAVLDSVRAACRDEDGQDPLDEAAALSLKHHGLDGARLWLEGSDGFALSRGSSVDLAVAPDARGAGLGARLAAVSLAGVGPVTAWSHGDHPAAARLAAAYGLERARELWVLRRPASLPLPAVPARTG